MNIGVPKEIKEDENRVAMVPAGVDILVKKGHRVFVEKGAGVGSGISDDDFRKAGARILEKHSEVFEAAEFIIKVKEPLAQEYDLIRASQVVFTFFHFAASEALTRAMLNRKCVCIAYETVEASNGSLPLLVPMSEVAGRMSIQEGAKYLEKVEGGRGVLLSGVPGVAPANVVIIGGGVVGSNAARIAAGLGAQVSILDINLERLRYLSDIMPPNVITLYSNAYNIQEAIKKADLVVGAVLVAGAKAPILIPADYLRMMKEGAVVVDVAIDQGGCVETSHPTTHRKPIFIIDGVVHYCVANIPGAVANTSTYALTNATFPYVLEIANKGWESAAIERNDIRKGVNMVRGKITNENVAKTFDLPYITLERILK